MTDIVGDLVGCVKEIGQCILTECIQPPVKRHFDYWWCFDDNIQSLRDGIRELDRQIYDFKQKIEEARLRLEVVRPGVEEWLEAITQKLAEAQRILPDDRIPKAYNLISRYSLGKKAKKTAEEIAKLRNDGNFNQIAHPAPTAAMVFPPPRSTTSMNFQSRKGIEDQIIDSLKQSSVGVIGICGMGGIGKTTMAKRIQERVKDEHLFDEVVMVTVSQTMDMFKIQNEISELFGLKLDVTAIPARAHKLRTRLMDTTRKIIILDDVWDPSVKFEELGIPIESNLERCKVLLTTRSRDTCKQFKNKVVFDLKILEEEEAWILFKEKAGECVEDSDSDLHRVAKDVAKECKGLPIALVAVGTALQDASIYEWKDSLLQLRRSNPVNFPEVLENVYKPLKLTYDYLKNDNDRNLFLMCCLFPEDDEIPIEQLTWCSMGLRLFGDITNIEEARNRTHSLVEKLKSRSLLIAGEDELHVKMHDVVRDVAIYIGSIEKDGFLKSLNSIENPSDGNCNWMSVDISNEQMEVHVLSRCPKLRLLMLHTWSSNQYSDELYDMSHISFEGMEDLNVLSFQDYSSKEWLWFRGNISLPRTLGLLKNLQTLRLVFCNVENISFIGELTSLKIFCCCRCENITELPAEIGRLKGLRLLELNRCSNLKRIPFGIISSLSLLEELKIRKCFFEWETAGGEMRNASLTELEHLRNLTCLEIDISDCTSSAQETGLLCQQLVRYRICIGAEDRYHLEFGDYEKVMIVNLAGAVGNWIRLLARNAESLTLIGDGSNNINLAEMENLRDLTFRKCSSVKKLVDTATPRLLQLEVLRIEDCESMEHVFWNEARDNHMYGCIEFPELEELTLSNLPNLTAFCQGLENIVIKFPNLTKLDIAALPKLNILSPFNSETETVVGHNHNTCFHFLCNCNPKVEMGLIEELTLSRFEDNIKNIWCHQIPNNFFNNLEILNISLMKGIRSLMSTSIAKNLVTLNFLRIQECEEMIEVIEIDDDNDKQVVDIHCLFPNLIQLILWNLPKLIRFWQWNQTLELPLLKIVSIMNCPMMETFTLGSINTPNIRKNYMEYHHKDLNDFTRHVWTKSQNTSETKED